MLGVEGRSTGQMYICFQYTTGGTIRTTRPHHAKYDHKAHRRWSSQNQKQKWRKPCKSCCRSQLHIWVPIHSVVYLNSFWSFAGKALHNIDYKAWRDVLKCPIHRFWNPCRGTVGSRRFQHLRVIVRMWAQQRCQQNDHTWSHNFYK